MTESRDEITKIAFEDFVKKASIARGAVAEMITAWNNVMVVRAVAKMFADKEGPGWVAAKTATAREAVEAEARAEAATAKMFAAWEDSTKAAEIVKVALEAKSKP